MPALTKTIIIPDQDPSPIFSSAILKLIILGDHPDIADRADNLSQNPPGIARYVIWYKTVPNNLRALFPELPANYISTVKAFSLSKTNKVAHIIQQNDVADYMLLMLAFNNAALTQNNLVL